MPIKPANMATSPGPEHFGYLLRIQCARYRCVPCQESRQSYLVERSAWAFFLCPMITCFPWAISGRDPKYLQLRERIRSDPFRIGCGSIAAGYRSHSGSQSHIIAALTR